MSASASSPPPVPGLPPRALVFGGSGQIGERLIERLLARGWMVEAWSRHRRPARARLAWRVGGLEEAPAPQARPEAVFSCGPLDHFARWYERAGPVGARVVAFGSTSVQVKRDSTDAHERELALRLHEAERRLYAAAAARGAAATVLRPTLVYGAGRDLTLTRIAALAGRAGFFVLPTAAAGLRQPVHVDDLADAALAVLGSAASVQRGYDLGGGETLPYEAMVRRVLAALPRPARLYRVPAPLFAAALRLAHSAGRLRGINAAALRRMRQDLVFDPEPARRDFGYAPRDFRPRAEELGVAAPLLPEAKTRTQ